ncbi:MAG: hypothetical protein RLZ87_443 [Armatimonadota bacterium]
MKNTGSRKQFEQTRPTNNYSTNLLLNDTNKLRTVSLPYLLITNVFKSLEATHISAVASDARDNKRLRWG